MAGKAASALTSPPFRTRSDGFWLAVRELIGFMGLLFYPENHMGEIVSLATLPAAQRNGGGRA